ncbi:TRAP transporter small permease [Tuberibacillus sp. Marseille-P3662]|uniref:TRAP transporter small permease n=1 Tax=Tuberibacillus sp. Marseille-P3662 TaxID=1965358 RepID=UPI000A1CA9F7|nr:TRAP transporter small permease [Tuberibacillus sp. Marseille-P3662]
MKERDLAMLPRYLISLMLFIIFALTIIQVFCRFVLDSPLTWTSELSRLLLIWMVMIGAGVVTYDRVHLSVDAIYQKLSVRPRFYLSMCLQLIIFAFLITTIISSFHLIRVSNDIASGALGISYAYWRVAAPIGFLFIIGYGVIRLYQDCRLYMKGLYPREGDEGEDML